MPEDDEPRRPYHGAHRRQLGRRAVVGLAFIALLLVALIASIAARSCQAGAG